MISPEAIQAAEANGTVIICCNTYPPRFIGGAELIAHNQAKTLKKLGWRVIVFTGDIKPQAHRHDMLRKTLDGIDIYRVNLTPQDYNYELVNFSHPEVDEHFKTLLDRYRPDVVHFHNIIGLSLGIIPLAKDAGAKTVLTVHDHWCFCFKNTRMLEDGQTCNNFKACKYCLPAIEDGADRHIPIRLRQDFLALTIRQIDAFVSPSAYLAKTYIAAGFPQERFHVVWNGIDTKRFRQMTKKPEPSLLRISFFGHFGKHKGIHTLLEALPIIKNKERLRVNLIGEGDQLHTYKSILESNGCSHLVRFWGKLANDEVEKVYAETDALILPSIWQENQPVSITEAMAAGIPVLASCMGGIPELVEDGVTGFLFDAGNRIQIQTVIDRLLQDPSVLHRWGQNAAKQMALHDYAHQVKKLLSIYRTPLNCGGEQSRKERLIVCIGCRFSLPSFTAVSSDSIISEPTIARFIHRDWCDREQLKSAWVYLVTDPELDLACLYDDHKLRSPLLVPADNEELVNHVRECSNGLYYSDSDELLACLEYLHENQEVYDALLRKAEDVRN